LTTGEDGQLAQIICIPKFSVTGEIVLVNLSTLESEVIRFNSGTIEKPEEKEQLNGGSVMNDIEEL